MQNIEDWTLKQMARLPRPSADEIDTLANELARKLRRARPNMYHAAQSQTVHGMSVPILLSGFMYFAEPSQWKNKVLCSSNDERRDA